MNKKYESAGNFVKIAIIAILIILQAVLMVFAIGKINEIVSTVYWAFQAIVILLCIHIVVSEYNTSFKISWILFVLIFPVVGFVFFFVFSHRVPKKLQNRWNKVTSEFKNYTNEKCENIINTNNFSNEFNIEDQRMFETIYNLSGCYPFKNTETTYLELGEKMFEVMLLELEKAEKFILIEYFIISKGQMKDRLFEVLIRKAKQGVEVKVLFDEAGSFGTGCNETVQTLRNNGIECHTFNPLSYHIYQYISFRDHRKITIIDGKVNISGGINIGDEYINGYVKHGHWKDTAVMIKGDAVYSFTLMFFSNWAQVTGEIVDATKYNYQNKDIKASGYVAPYCDGPMNDKNPSENIYLKMINSARKYLYITTPYLILDTDLVKALSLSALSGVDVKIITPFVPDKKMIQNATRSFYPDLIKNGVQIYEYTPGFIHAKSMVSDDRYGICGSINLDFRSLSWNYECATFMCETDSIKDMKEDFLNTIKVSNKIEMVGKNTFYKQLKNGILHIIAPLL